MVTATNTQVLTICLVDDDPSVLKATSRLLASSGWNVESFLDPIAFLRLAEIHRPLLTHEMHRNEPRAREI